MCRTNKRLVQSAKGGGARASWQANGSTSAGSTSAWGDSQYDPGRRFYGRCEEGAQQFTPRAHQTLRALSARNPERLTVYSSMRQAKAIYTQQMDTLLTPAYRRTSPQK